jgi:hypothetical protein
MIVVVVQMFSDVFSVQSDEVEVEEGMDNSYTKEELNLYKCLQEVHGTLEIFLGDIIILPKGILPKKADFELLRP